MSPTKPDKIVTNDEPKTSKRSFETSPDADDENHRKIAKRSDFFFEINEKISDSFDAIFSVIYNNYGDDSYLKSLLESGSDIQIRENVFGYTLLHMAAHCSDPKKFKTLLTNHADVNAKAKNDVTPLHLAAMVGNVDIVKMLIESHVDVDCLTSDMRLSPLHLAIMKIDKSEVYANITEEGFDQLSLVNLSWIKPVRDRNALAVLELLIESGADVYARDANGNTVLHLATLESDKNVIRTLLKFGAYVDVTNAKGESPLHYVLKSFNVDGLTSLLEFGADINDISRQFHGIREYESSQANAFYNAVLEHTNKLRAADLPVDEGYKSDFHKSFWSSHRLECSREVERLKRFFVVDNVSLYEFLRMSVRRRRAYVRYVPKDLEMKFPKYYGIVYGSCRQAEVRRSLLESAKVVWCQLTEIELPDICLEWIFSFLGNADLAFFVAEAHGYLKVEKKVNSM